MVRSYCGEEQLDAAQIAYGALSLPPEGSGGEDIPAETAWTASGNRGGEKLRSGGVEFNCEKLRENCGKIAGNCGKLRKNCGKIAMS